MSLQHDRTAWLQGGDALCQQPPTQTSRPYRLVLLGAPGVGKGTQAELLCQGLGTCHLSTGDVFRAAKCRAEGELSPALKEAFAYMNQGKLVPDSTVLDMVRERTRCLRCGGGFLLDGFPRTVPQAEALDALLKQEELELDGVLSYELPLNQIIDRLSGRRTCAGCKAVFHVSTRPPRQEGVCDHCGQPLFQREDDRPESIKVRMEAYRKSTSPLTDYFRRKGLLLEVPAQGSPEEIYQRTLNTLARAGKYTAPTS